MVSKNKETCHDQLARSQASQLCQRTPTQRIFLDYLRTIHRILVISDLSSRHMHVLDQLLEVHDISMHFPCFGCLVEI